MLTDSQPEYWFKTATHDMETVDLLVKEKGQPDIIIYHQHQAVEKILKGLIIENKSTFPYIHDLERLYKILSAKTNRYDGIDKNIISLQSYYKDFRYPQSDFLTEKDLPEAQKAYDNILKIISQKTL